MSRTGASGAIDRPAIRGAILADLIAMTKPRVVLMILLVTAVGFVMGSPAGIDMLRLLGTLFGTALVSAGTLALNQYMERDLDGQMKRTHSRPLPAGRVEPIDALAFGAALTAIGLLYLTFAVNPLSGFITSLTVIGYLFVYTPLKTRSALCTVAGAFPGALPPVTGWTAAAGELGLGAVILFGILFFWQLPHSLAIAQLYREDYQRAGIRLLPTVDRDGMSTGRQTILNCVALLALGLMPTVVGLSGWITFAVAAVLGGLMLARGIAMAVDPGAPSARRLLIASYVYVPAVMIVMAVDRL